MSRKPVLVFVPGAWHKPACYEKLIQVLKSNHNVACVSITLLSTLGDRNATFEDDLQAARRIITNEIEQINDVVVVAHSYGGMVANSAIKGLTKASQASVSSTGNNEHGYVIGLILIAPGFTLTGMAFMDPFFGIPSPSWKKNTETGFAELLVSPRELFYHDLPVEGGNYWVSQLTPQSLKSLFEGGEFAYAGWQDVPTWYVGTLEDKALPLWAQRLNMGMASGMGEVVVHRELQTSHSPFLSRPDEVAEIVVEAIKEFQLKQAKGERFNRRLSLLNRVRAFD